MTSPLTPFNPATLKIRPLQLRDIDAIAQLAGRVWGPEQAEQWEKFRRQVELYQSWYGILRLLRLFPNPTHHQFCIYVAEQEGQVRSVIYVTPFNRSRSTWRVEFVLHDVEVMHLDQGLHLKDAGSQLLRYCFENIWEARTWVLEVNVNDKSSLSLYRQNGFQPLAQNTYWSISPEIQAQLARSSPGLPNLLPVGNADAQLLYQLDTVSMPPLLRQVFDRHVTDFRTPLFHGLCQSLQSWFNQQERVRGYVFEPQRKAAIGYLSLTLSKGENIPHRADLTVHPAYTWLYPELMIQMTQVTQTLPPQPLLISSSDYQQEREEYLEKLGAERLSHTLVMSRSVWHKLRETRPREGLQLSDVLGLQPARTPIPTRMTWTKFGPRDRKQQPPEAQS